MSVDVGRFGRTLKFVAGATRRLDGDGRSSELEERVHRAWRVGLRLRSPSSEYTYSKQAV
jgi:hypothetical protein